MLGQFVRHEAHAMIALDYITRGVRVIVNCSLPINRGQVRRMQRSSLRASPPISNLLLALQYWAQMLGCLNERLIMISRHIVHPHLTTCPCCLIGFFRTTSPGSTFEAQQLLVVYGTILHLYSSLFTISLLHLAHPRYRPFVLQP